MIEWTIIAFACFMCLNIGCIIGSFATYVILKKSDGG